MSKTLNYGRDSTLALSTDESVTLVSCAPEVHALDDWQQALEHALSSPADYLPLASVVTSGDKVTVAIEPGTPQAEAIVSYVVDYLITNGIAPGDISILQHPPEPGTPAADMKSRLAASAREHVSLHVHDSSQRDKLGYLSNTRGGKPVYLHRLLSDADAVVLVGCLRSSRSSGYLGPGAAIYPGFSDDRTQQRFRNPALLARNKQMVRGAVGEIDRVAWMAGAPFMVEVVPGPGGTISDFVTGDLASVARTGKARMQVTWEMPAPQRGDLVVAALSGGEEQQTWDNIGRALAAALRVANADGAIVLCTDLSAAPGVALQQLAGSDDWDRALLQFETNRPADLFTATMLVRAYQQARLYLLSRLDETIVEQLNMIPVTDPADVGRLVERNESSVLLPDAQFIWPTIER